MKKFLSFQSVLFLFLFLTNPVFAQTAGGVGQIETFIRSIVQVLITLVGSVAVVFFVVGGFRYITSTGNPMALDKAKQTILYSAVGLAVALGAFVLMNVISQLATSAFGSGA